MDSVKPILDDRSLGLSFRRLVLESVLAGDQRCRFAKIPEKMLDTGRWRGS